ncbi:transcriptional regulator [Haloferax mucosum ATCC BAA-1512]|uniref:Transcriptional regulator n=1 Tax=Haloferax mucosum ATCC BAA-1512 TaxID=662479 RepID=M0IQ94_9EURY|nr:helix-turn-helix domain-containing protein [Haloferax mucosum]ELZ98996.1 transcriptional regulator [Haloferax mucosum ATCC BAA-1512]
MTSGRTTDGRKPDPDDAAAQATDGESPLEDTLADLALFTRSPVPLRILDCLDESPRTTTQLDDALDVHRTTLKRNLERLRERECVRSNPIERGHRITSVGRLYLRGLEEVVETARDADRLATVRSGFPEELPGDVAYLRDCRITTAAPYNPHAPQERLQRLLIKSGSVRLFAPQFPPHYLEILTSRTEDTAACELVIPAPVVDYLKTVRPSLVERVVASMTVYGADELTDIAVGVGHVDERPVIVVYDDNKHVQAVVEVPTDRSPVREWVRDQYRDRRQRASVVTN